MEEQKRGMIMSQLGFVPGQTNQAIGYVAEAGFYVFWDFVVGIPNRFRQTQIVYGLYEYGQSRLGPRLVSPVAVENDPFNEASCRAIFNLDHDIKDMTPSQSIYLIIEIQGIGDNQKVSNIGWTAFDIFTAQNALNEGI